MSGIFVNNDDTVTINVYTSMKNGNLSASISRGAFAEDADVKEYEFIFRYPSYKDNIDVMRDSIRSSLVGEEQSLEFNPAMVRYERFCKLLMDWNITDKDGEKVPANRTNINRLNPVLAGVVLDELEMILYGSSLE